MTAQRARSLPTTSAQVGPYQLGRCLGVGGMGEVWMARRTGIAGTVKEVAIKLLHEEFEGIDEVRAMFLAEARQAMWLNSSNIVQVFDVGESDDGRCYLVMEFVDGIDLSILNTRLRAADERMPAKVAAYILGELLKALICTHELRREGEVRPLVHRDVTPDNVMLSTWGEVKLMDFGIAHSSCGDTGERYAAGKIRYMAPEQLTGNGCEPPLDLFALGGILHELLDGQAFRDGIKAGTLRDMVEHGLVDPLREPKRAPPILINLREELLTADVSKRIPSARVAYQRLSQWSGYRDARLELEALVRRFAPSWTGRVETTETRTDGRETWTSTSGWSTPTPNSVVKPTPPDRGQTGRLLTLILLCFVLIMGPIVYAVTRPPAVRPSPSPSVDHPPAANFFGPWIPWRDRSPAPEPPLPELLILDLSMDDVIFDDPAPRPAPKPEPAPAPAPAPAPRLEPRPAPRLEAQTDPRDLELLEP